MAVELKVYWAAPLFTQAERDFNQARAALLVQAGFSVYLPQEHAPPLPMVATQMRQVVNENIHAINRSHVVVAVVDGADVDSGTAWELGFAHALGKSCLLYRTDFRGGHEYQGLNLMLAFNGFVKHNWPDVLNWLIEYRDRQQWFEGGV